MAKKSPRKKTKAKKTKAAKAKKTRPTKARQKPAKKAGKSVRKAKKAKPRARAAKKAQPRKKRVTPPPMDQIMASGEPLLSRRWMSYRRKTAIDFKDMADPRPDCGAALRPQPMFLVPVIAKI